MQPRSSNSHAALADGIVVEAEINGPDATVRRIRTVNGTTRTMRRAMVTLAIAVVVLATAAGCTRTGTTTCDSIAPPSSPADGLTSLSFGYAAVLGTVGDRIGTTKVYDPGYKADLYGFEVEQVLVNQSDLPAGEVSEVANVHYPKPPAGCGDQIPAASLQPGQRMILILGPPDPSKTVWTVDGDVRALDLPEQAGGEAIWQSKVAGCAVRLMYDVPELTAAFTDAAARSALLGMCSS